MKALHSPTFESALAARVRKACRRHKADWREHQRGVEIRRRAWLSKSFGLLFSTLLIAVLVATVVRHAGELRLPLLALALVGWWLGTGFINALRNQLVGSTDVLALRNLPILDSQVFAFQWRSIARSHGATSLLLIGVATVVCVSASGRADAMAFVGAALAGGLTWWQGRAVGVWVACLGWQTYVVWFHIALVGLGVGSFLPKIGPVLLPVLIQAEPILSLVMPTAWPGRMLADTLQHGPGVTLLLLVPAAALGWSIKLARERLAAGFETEEPLFALPLEAFGGSEAAEDGANWDEDAFPQQPDAKPPAMRAGPTELEEFVRGRAWLAPESWAGRGWIERQVEQRLTPRERVLVEVMMPGQPMWSATWLHVGKIVAVLSLLGLGVDWLGMRWFFLLYIMAAAALLFFVMPVASGLGRTCGPYWAGGATFTFHAGFPLTYREFTRLAWKIAVVRGVAALPMAMAFTTFLFFKYGGPRDPWWVGPVTGLWATWFFLSARPLLSATRWSTGTSGTQSVTVWSLLAWAVAVLAFILFTVLGVSTWFAVCAEGKMPHWFALPLALATMGISFSFQWFFGRLVARNRFDYTPSRAKSFELS